MARSQSARRHDFAYPAALDSHGFGTAVTRYLPSEHVLRRLIPYLIAIFFVLVVAGTAAHFMHAKSVALEEARSRTYPSDAVSTTITSAQPASH